MTPRIETRGADHWQPRQPLRNWRGQFAKLVCVNAHDRCYGGAGGSCPYCEVRP